MRTKTLRTKRAREGSSEGDEEPPELRRRPQVEYNEDAIFERSQTNLDVLRATPGTSRSYSTAPPPEELSTGSTQVAMVLEFLGHDVPGGFMLFVKRHTDSSLSALREEDEFKQLFHSVSPLPQKHAQVLRIKYNRLPLDERLNFEMEARRMDDVVNNTRLQQSLDLFLPIKREPSREQVVMPSSEVVFMSARRKEILALENDAVLCPFCPADYSKPAFTSLEEFVSHLFSHSLLFLRCCEHCQVASTSTEFIDSHDCPCRDPHQSANEKHMIVVLICEDCGLQVPLRINHSEVAVSWRHFLEIARVHGTWSFRPIVVTLGTARTVPKMKVRVLPRRIPILPSTDRNVNSPSSHCPICGERFATQAHRRIHCLDQHPIKNVNYAAAEFASQLKSSDFSDIREVGDVETDARLPPGRLRRTVADPLPPPNESFAHLRQLLSTSYATIHLNSCSRDANFGVKSGNEVFFCNGCADLFEGEVEMNSHVATCQKAAHLVAPKQFLIRGKSVEPMQCPRCEMRLCSVDALRSHLLLEHGVTSLFHCSERTVSLPVARPYSISEQLNRRLGLASDGLSLESVGSPTPYENRDECPLCGIFAKSESALKVHFGCHTEIKHWTSCALCVSPPPNGARVFSPEDFALHLISQHCIPKEGQFECHACRAVMKRADVVAHLLIDCREVSSCLLCPPSASESDILVHRTVEHRDISQRFTCVSCGKKFAFLDSTAREHRCDTGDVMFVCDGEPDQKSFRSKKAFNVHFNTVHGATSMQRHACQICNQSVRTYTELKTHAAVHMLDVHDFFNLPLYRRFAVPSTAFVQGTEMEGAIIAETDIGLSKSAATLSDPPGVSSVSFVASSNQPSTSGLTLPVTSIAGLAFAPSAPIPSFVTSVGPRQSKTQRSTTSQAGTETAAPTTSISPIQAVPPQSPQANQQLIVRPTSSPVDRMQSQASRPPTELPTSPPPIAPMILNRKSTRPGPIVVPIPHEADAQLSQEDVDDDIIVLDDSLSMVPSTTSSSTQTANTNQSTRKELGDENVETLEVEKGRTVELNEQIDDDIAVVGAVVMRKEEQSESRERSFPCRLCSKKFNTEGGLKEHERGHRETGPSINIKDALGLPELALVYACRECLYAFESVEKFREHMATHSQPSFACLDCSGISISTSYFDGHKKTHLSKTERYYCAPCRCFFRREILVHHRLSIFYYCKKCLAGSTDLETFYYKHIQFCPMKANFDKKEGSFVGMSVARIWHYVPEDVEAYKKRQSVPASVCNSRTVIASDRDPLVSCACGKCFTLVKINKFKADELYRTQRDSDIDTWSESSERLPDFMDHFFRLIHQSGVGKTAFPQPNSNLNEALTSSLLQRTSLAGTYPSTFDFSPVLPNLQQPTTSASPLLQSNQQQQFSFVQATRQESRQSRLTPPGYVHQPQQQVFGACRTQEPDLVGVRLCNVPPFRQFGYAAPQAQQGGRPQPAFGEHQRQMIPLQHRGLSTQQYMQPQQQRMVDAALVEHQPLVQQRMTIPPRMLQSQGGLQPQTAAATQVLAVPSTPLPVSSTNPTVAEILQPFAQESCKVCGMALNTEQEFRLHCLHDQRTVPQTHFCLHCSRSFEDESSLVKHIFDSYVQRDAEQRPIVSSTLMCPFQGCLFSSDRVATLRNHFKSLHCVSVYFKGKAFRAVPSTCCDTLFYSEAALYAHDQKHLRFDRHGDLQCCLLCGTVNTWSVWSRYGHKISHLDVHGLDKFSICRCLKFNTRDDSMHTKFWAHYLERHAHVQLAHRVISGTCKNCGRYFPNLQEHAIVEHLVSYIMQLKVVLKVVGLKVRDNGVVELRADSAMPRFLGLE